MPHARTRTRFASVLSTAAKLTADGTSMLAESGPETDRPLLLHNNDD